MDGTFTEDETAYVLAQTWNAPPEYRLRLTLSNEKSPATPLEKNKSDPIRVERRSSPSS